MSSDEPTGDTIPSSSVSLPLGPQPPPPSAGSFFVTLGDANAIMRSGAAVFPSSELQASVALAGGGEVRSAGNTETSLGWDYIDVDPFGSCLPFLEAAVAGVRDGGLLAVAATDLAVLCGKRGSQVCASIRSIGRPRTHTIADLMKGFVYSRCYVAAATAVRHFHGKRKEVKNAFPPSRGLAVFVLPTIVTDSTVLRKRLFCKWESRVAYIVQLFSIFSPVSYCR